ncbi:MAG: flagellar basal body P-ring protein FlgI [Deltaproteobacteria bacterium]|nr:flagellar basal body P-ring protein FlgI [Deltaproteobacteria bacterium]
MRVTALAILFVLLSAAPAFADRLKDLGFVRGVRDNEIVGYGIVVGLKGTGDDQGSAFTPQSVSTMLRRLGVQVDPKALRLRNAAAVMVTARLPPFARSGVRIDVTVSSLGTATSLQGGTLLETPLIGPDQRTYALAQGSLSIGGFEVAGRTGTAIHKNHLTAARIPLGATVETEFVPSGFLEAKEIVWALREADFTTARNIAEAVTKTLGEGTAKALDPSAVRINVPEEYAGRVAELVAKLESLDAVVDGRARVVVNERTGTVVASADVRIGKAAVAHGGLVVEVREQYVVSQPGAFSGGQTAVIPESDVRAAEQGGQVHLVEGASLNDVVRVLNGLGATPRDLIAILQALRRAGSLRAEVEVQ